MADDTPRLEYRGFWKAVNEKPDEGIQLWASDWNKNYWGFYAWIERADYESDVPAITELISRLNSRDGDVYTELLDHTRNLGDFYDFLHRADDGGAHEALRKEWWELLEEKGDEHFAVWHKVRGEKGSLEEMANFDYVSFSDGAEFLETYHPRLYDALQEACAFDHFDIRGFMRHEPGVYWNEDGSLYVVLD